MYGYPDPRFRADQRRIIYTVNPITLGNVKICLLKAGWCMADERKAGGFERQISTDVLTPVRLF